MDIHVTERRDYKRCRRKWDLSSPNRQNLEKKALVPSLTLGTLMHGAFDDWTMDVYRNEITTPMFDAHFDQRARQKREEITHMFRGQLYAGILNAELEEFDKLVVLGRAMAANYEKFYTKPFPPGWKVEAIEQAIRVPIPYTNHFIVGKLDAIVTDPDERVWVVDRKTFDKHPSEQDIDVDDQFLGYQTLATLMYPNRRMGGVLYDGMWKRPAPPKGRRFDELFLRRKVYRNQHAMNEWLGNLVVEVAEMTSEPAIYPTRDWTCVMCPFREMCIAQTNGEDIAYLRDNLYTSRRNSENLSTEASLTG